VHEVLDAVGAEQPVDRGVRAAVSLKQSYGVDREARRGPRQLAIADGERFLSCRCERHHVQSVFIAGVGRESLEGRAFGGDEDHFLRTDLFRGGPGHAGVTSMNRVERASEQCNSSSRHTLLTAYLCVAGLRSNEIVRAFAGPIMR